MSNTKDLQLLEKTKEIARVLALAADNGLCVSSVNMETGEVTINVYANFVSGVPAPGAYCVAGPDPTLEHVDRYQRAVFAELLALPRHEILSQPECSFILNNQKINAIKSLHSRTNLSTILDAKKVIDKWISVLEY